MLKKLILGVFILFLGMGVAAAWLYQEMLRTMNSPLLGDDQPSAFVVAPGMGLNDVVGQLNQQGLIQTPEFALVWARLNKIAHRLKAGEYALTPGLTAKELFDNMVKGEVVHHSITLLEGWNIRQMLAEVARHEQLKVTLDHSDIMSLGEQLNLPTQHPEGWFFPDTYHFTRGTTDEALLKRAHQAMVKYLDQAWEKRVENLPFKNAYEALSLASIVEKETGVVYERPKIAGVFVRRLQKRMRLQADPTVIYGMGEAFDGNIRRRDLRTDTPYNTYTRHGITPTPIAMPSGAAIDAVLNPEDGNELYFVAKGDGSHYFSATIHEHNRAVRKYQLKR